MLRSGRVIVLTLHLGHGSGTCIGSRHCGSGETLWGCGGNCRQGSLRKPSSAGLGASGGSGTGEDGGLAERTIIRHSSGGTGNMRSFCGKGGHNKGYQLGRGITTTQLAGYGIDGAGNNPLILLTWTGNLKIRYDSLRFVTIPINTKIQQKENETMKNDNDT